MDQMLEQYLKQKYGDDYQQKSDDQYQEKKERLNTASAISGWGDALAGRAPGSQDDYFQKKLAAEKNDSIGKIADDKKSYMAEAGFENEQKQAKIKQDAYDSNSSQSVAYRKMMEAKFPDVAKTYGAEWANVSAGDQDNIFKPLQLKEQIEARKEAARITAAGQKDSRDQRQFDKDKAEAEKSELLMTTFGKARTPDDAKKIKEAAVLKQNFDSKLQDMIALREKHKGGNITDREDVQRGQQLSKDLLLAYKDMAKLGVLSVSDEKILNAIIPEDPLSYNSPMAAIQGQDPIMHRMKSFKTDSGKDFDNRLGQMLRNPAPQKPQKNIVKTQVNQKTGQTRIVYDDGSIEIQEKQVGR